jgi:hypothetical protein
MTGKNTPAPKKEQRNMSKRKTNAMDETERPQSPDYKKEVGHVPEGIIGPRIPLWLVVPLDSVGADEAVGGDEDKRAIDFNFADGPDIDVPTAEGVLRVSMLGVNPTLGGLALHVYWRDSGEEVASLDLVDGEQCVGIDAAAGELLELMPTSTVLIFCRPAAPENVEAAERLEAGPQPQMTTPNKKEEADDILLT